MLRRAPFCPIGNNRGVSFYLVSDEFAKGYAMDFQAAGDAGFGVTAPEQAGDFYFASGKLDPRTLAAFGSPKNNALGAAAG